MQLEEIQVMQTAVQKQYDTFLEHAAGETALLDEVKAEYEARIKALVAWPEARLPNARPHPLGASAMSATSELFRFVTLRPPNRVLMHRIESRLIRDRRTSSSVRGTLFGPGEFKAKLTAAEHWRSCPISSTRPIRRSSSSTPSSTSFAAQLDVRSPPRRARRGVPRRRSPSFAQLLRRVATERAPGGDQHLPRRGHGTASMCRRRWGAIASSPPTISSTRCASITCWRCCG